MIRAAFLSSVLILVGAVSAPAQDREQTLADIRQELTVLYVEVQRLKRELSTTGGVNVPLGGTSALDRIDAIESELQRLTSATERLQNRVDRVVTDGTNRIGDLEFRLVELEGGDISQLGETTTLGGDTGLPPVALPPPSSGGGAQLAVGEQADFDVARAAFEAGNYEDAAERFNQFTQTYTGGPLTAEAHFWRGEALSAMGSPGQAARAYLESFSGDPDGMMAPDALLRLGLSLDALGQADESCLMLSEVMLRFPGSAASDEAQAARADMGCV
ncbi:MAG: tol-pal system protein YbgF [Alphaproteobacteria bacterium]|nr:tol-pal system protein YbgF [Alphaproteobacteria bacterium]